MGFETKGKTVDEFMHEWKENNAEWRNNNLRNNAPCKYLYDGSEIAGDIVIPFLPIGKGPLMWCGTKKVSVAKSGIKVASELKNGKALTESEIIASSGIGNLKGTKGVSKAEAGWDMSAGGGNINGRRYSQHAMERMAPNTPEVKAELYQRATKIAKEKGLVPQTKEYSTFIDKYVDPRNIPPSVIEDAIKNTKPIPGNRPDTFVHATDSVKVITNGNGDVITVIPK